MGMQMRVYSFWCLSLNLNSDTYPDKLLLQQAVLPEAVHLPSKHIQWDDHNSFSSGLVVFGLFLLSAVPLWPSTGDLAKEEQSKAESGLWLTMPFSSQPLRGPSRAREEINFRGCAGSLLCYWSPGSPWFQAAPSHVGCITKRPTIYLFSRKSHRSTQVFLIVMEHIHHNSKEKLTPCFFCHSVPSFLLPMRHPANILHSQQGKRCFSYLRVWLKNT